ncbi:MAG: glycosyltransferase family 4 protein [Planctomycetales bacterium]|nr:glycosyltransferase family 4 protein [Planctomycetales bacterium]
MRIAYVCSDPGVPVFGSKGCSVHAQEVLRAMQSAGCQIDLFARRLGGPRPANLQWIRVHELSSPDGPRGGEFERQMIVSNRPLRLALETAGPFDLIYERYALWSHAAMQFGRDHGTRTILEVNSPLVKEQSQHRRLVDAHQAHRITASAFANADAIVAVSTQVAQYIRTFAETSDKVTVIPNGVDPDRFRVAREAIRRRVIHQCESLDRPALAGATEAEPIVVGFVGNLRPWHGLGVLGEAFSIFHQRVPNARLLVVGDGDAREELERELTPSARLATQITGRVRADEVTAWLARMDIAVAPYPSGDEFYFSPLKVFEYMAAGLPVVASRIGDIPALIRDGENGLLCRAGDAHEQADAWSLLAGNAQLRMRLGQQAVSTVASHHTWKQVVAQTLTLGRTNVATAARSAG